MSEAKPDGTRLVTESELIAFYLPVCRKTLVTHRKRGKIPFVKLGRRILYDVALVKAALLQNGGVQ